MSTADALKTLPVPAFVKGQAYGMAIQPATSRQIDFLKALGRKNVDSRTCTYREADDMIADDLARRRTYP